MNSIRILLWNARKFKSKKEKVNEKFKEIGVDIEIITEIKNNINNRANNVSVTGYYDITENLYNKGRSRWSCNFIVKKDIIFHKI